MWGELFQDGTPSEIAQMLLIVAGMGFAFMVPIVWICSKIIALREKPERRALKTVAPAYVVVALAFIFMGGEFISPWLAPMVPLPAAILIWLWLRNTYRKGWVDDDNIPEGTKLENSDWRIGVAIVVGVVIIGAIRAALRAS